MMELGQIGDAGARSGAANLVIELSERGGSFDDDQDGILVKVTRLLPSNMHISDSLTYGVFYYYEALQRLTGTHQICW